MKTVSFLDLQLIPELFHLSQFDMMSPDNDYLVNPFLHKIGFDLDRCGLEYRVCQHRSLTGKTVLGLQIAGEERIDREFLSSSWATAEDKMIAAGRYDRSLGNELSNMLGVTVQYGNVFALDDEETKEHWMDQEEIERIEDQLASLGIALENTRGDQRKRDGSLKRPRDYHEQEVFEKVRKKKANRSTLKHREIT